MNKLHLVPTLALAASLVAPAAFAQSSTQQSGSSQNRTTQQDSDWNKDKKSNKKSMSNAQLGDLKRVTQESVNSHFTASDFIGKAVYDQQGEKIGTIDDLSVQPEIASRFSAAAEGSSDSSSSRSGSSSMGQMGGETHVFISVGGMFGIGDDIVSAPASALTYDEQEDRFTLSHSKDEVVALAEQESSEYGQYDSSDQTMSGSQQWSDEVSGIREVLREDEQLSDQGAGIIVTSEGDKIHLRGTVSSRDEKQRAEELAKQHTDMDVENSITVRD